jgi:hypothetical protein
LMGIALFMTIFIMWPTFTAIYTNALQPMAQGEISVETAYREAETPLSLYMYSQMRTRPEISGSLCPCGAWTGPTLWRTCRPTCLSPRLS